MALKDGILDQLTCALPEPVWRLRSRDDQSAPRSVWRVIVGPSAICLASQLDALTTVSPSSAYEPW